MEDTVSRAEKLQERMIDFAANVIVTTGKMPLPKSIIDQVARSSASIGANYSEALNASSKTDFRNKIYIVKKEAAETKYWLKLAEKILQKPILRDQINECQSLLMVLQKTVNTINVKRQMKN